MTLLKKRAWRVTIAGLRFTGLDISFEVSKTGGREPNKCALKVWNLPPDARAELAQTSTTRRTSAPSSPLVLEAGYEGATSLIFRGDLRTASSEKQGADWLTSVEGEDGGRAVRWSRVSQSFPAGTRIDTVLRACAEAMGVGLGNLSEVTSAAQLRGGGSTFSAGTVLHGSAPDELTHLLRSVGCTWSIQDGVLQVLQRGRALQSTAVRLSASSGLVGLPTRQADGTMKFIGLLQPDLYPGRQVQLDTPSVRGLFRVQKTKTTGDTAGLPWYVECESVDLQPIG